MERKFLLFLSIILTNYFYVNAQTVYNQGGRNKNVNLFNYGDTVISNEINFKNLFNNFPRFVDSSKDFSLNSYNLVDTVKSKEEVEKYVYENIQYGAIKWEVFKRLPGDILEKNSPTSDNYPYLKLISFKYFDYSAYEIDWIVDTLFKKYVDVGDEVFEIKFKVGKRSYNHYIFVNPENHKVNLKCNLFGFNIPNEMIEYYELKEEKQITKFSKDKDEEN